MKCYLVTLCNGGIFRIMAGTADLARQRVTDDHQKRVASVEEDKDQSVLESEDY